MKTGRGKSYSRMKIEVAGEIVRRSESLRILVPCRSLGQSWMRTDCATGRFGELRPESTCDSLSWGEPKKVPSRVWSVEGPQTLSKPRVL